MRISPIFIAIALALGVHLSALAQILVGPSGFPALTFDSSPILPAAEWSSSLTLIGAGGNAYTSPADVAAAVQTVDQSSIASPLERVTTNSSAVPSETFQHNITTGFLISASSGVGATLLKATLRNNTAQAISHIQIGYNFGVYISPSGETAPGHQAFFSTNGLPNSWQPIPAFSGLIAAAPVNATLFVGRWLPNTDIFLLWADDNSPNNPDGGYTIDNFSSAGVSVTNVTLPLSVGLSSPVNGTVVFPPVTLSANAAGTPAPTSVSFYTNGVLAAIDTSAPYSLTYATLAAGAYSIYAVASNGVTVAYSGTNTVRVRPEFVQYNGGTYLETFDSMGASGAETPFGWYGGINLPATIIDVTADDGSIGASNTVAAWNYGTSGNGDRALGTVATGSERDIVLRFRNNTANSLVSFALLYDGEVWRNYTNPAVIPTLTNYVSFDTGATWIATGPSFNFTQPFPSAFPQGPVNGNNSTNRQSNLGGVITPPSLIPPGGVIYLRWQDINDAGTDGGLAIDNVRITGTFPPANDLCAGAIAITPGAVYSVNTTDATSSGETASCGGLGKGVWYRYTPSSTEQVVVNTCGSDFDTVIQVFTGTSCGSLAPLNGGCVDDNGPACSGTRSSVGFTANANSPYWILVGGYSSAVGNLSLTMSVCAAPTSVNVSVGSATAVPNGTRVDYSVSFSGSPATSYDWSFDGSFFTTTFSPSLSRTYGPFDQLPSTVSVTVRNACGNGGGSSGTPPPCGAICLSTGTPVTRTGTDGSGANSFDYYTGCGDFLASNTKWFRISGIASTNAVVTVTSSGSTYNTRLAVFQGSISTPGNLFIVACNTTLLRFQSQPGNNYWLAVNSPGASTLQLNYGYYAVPPPPPNDSCAGAIPLSDGVLFSTNTVDASDDSPPSCFSPVVKGVWFTFTPSFTGRLDVETCGSDFPTVLALYSGSCASLVSRDCNSGYGPACSTDRASLSVPNITGGVTYRILAGGYSGSGNLRIRATLCPYPRFQGLTTTVFEEPNGIRVRYQANFTDAPFEYDWSFSDGVSFPNDDDTVERFYGAFDPFPTSVQISVQNSCGPNSGSPGTPPPCGAICLSLGTPTTRTGTNGSSLNAFSYPNFPSATTRWFKIPNTNFASLITVSTEGSTYDTVLGLFRGFVGSQGTLTQIAFNQDISATNNRSRLQFEYRPTDNYWLAVNSPSATSTLKLTCSYDLQLAALNYNRTNRTLDLRSAPLPSLRYGLLSTTNLAAIASSWNTNLTTNFTGNASASNNVLRYSDTNPPSSTRRFYQIKLLP